MASSYPDKRKGKVRHHLTINNHNTGSESQRRPSRDKGFRNHEVRPPKTVIFNYQSSVMFILVPQTLCYTSARIQGPQAWTKEARFLATFCTRSGFGGGGVFCKSEIHPPYLSRKKTSSIKVCFHRM